MSKDESVEHLREENGRVNCLNTILEQMCSLMNPIVNTCKCHNDVKVKTQLNILRHKYEQLKNGKKIMKQKRTIKRELIKLTEDFNVDNCLIGGKTRKCVLKINKTRVTCSWPGCDATFRDRYDLKKHIISHTGERNFVCDFPGCEKRYPHKRGLVRHQGTHSGYKRFTCDWPGCEYGSLYPEGLRAHKRSHTDERPFKCNWPSCEWSFRRSGHLKAHVLKHTGEKPVRCEVEGCDRRFQSRQAMRFHVKKIHKHILL